jgi:hypothetical protein
MPLDAGKMSLSLIGNIIDESNPHTIYVNEAQLKALKLFYTFEQWQMVKLKFPEEGFRYFGVEVKLKNPPKKIQKEIIDLTE